MRKQDLIYWAILGVLGICLYNSCQKECPEIGPPRIIKTIVKEEKKAEIPTVAKKAEPDTSRHAARAAVVMPADTDKCCEELTALLDTAEYSMAYEDTLLRANIRARVVGAAVDTFWFDYKAHWTVTHENTQEFIPVYQNARRYRFYLGGTGSLGVVNSYSIWGAVPIRRSLIKGGYNLTTKQVEIGYGLGIF